MLIDNSYIAMTEAAEAPIESAMNPVDFIYYSNVVNFIFVVIFLGWLFTKKVPIASIIADRQESIKKKIIGAEDEKSRTESELQQTEVKVGKSDGEIKDIITEAGSIAGSLAERIKKEAELGSEDIHKKGLRTIELEKDVASNNVRLEISKAAFFIAEEHIKQAIDEKLHKKYIDEFIDDLDNLKV